MPLGIVPVGSTGNKYRLRKQKQERKKEWKEGRKKKKKRRTRRRRKKERKKKNKNNNNNIQSPPPTTKVCCSWHVYLWVKGRYSILCENLLLKSTGFCYLFVGWGVGVGGIFSSIWASKTTWRRGICMRHLDTRKPTLILISKIWRTSQSNEKSSQNNDQQWSQLSDQTLTINFAQGFSLKARSHSVLLLLFVFQLVVTVSERSQRNRTRTH